MHKQNENNDLCSYDLCIPHTEWLSDYFSIFFFFRQKSSGYMCHLQTVSNNLLFLSSSKIHIPFNIAPTLSMCEKLTITIPILLRASCYDLSIPTRK